jgi:SSS family solute:Na+ symporter
MIIAVFTVMMVLSIAAAAAARFGIKNLDIDHMLVASRSLPAFMVFILAVGEVYSIGSVVAFPAGIYAKGMESAYWYIGYLILAYPFAYFTAPLIWRAARRHNALTVPEVFGRHFESRPLEIVMSIGALIAVATWGQFQFVGIKVALAELGLNLSPAGLLATAACLAFIYVGLAGVKGSAFVAFIKDSAMMLGIVAVGVAGIWALWGPSQAAATVVSMPDSHRTMSSPALTFAVTTILFQGFGLYLQPSVTPFVFTGKSEAAVKSATVFMPLYLLMLPFGAFAALYGLAVLPGSSNPNRIFLEVAEHLLPSSLVGFVIAGACLAGILVLSVNALTCAAIVTRNLVPGIPPQKQRFWTRVTIALFLIVAATLTLVAPKLMLSVLNFSNYIAIQFGVGWLAIFFGRRVSALSVGLGLIVGVGVAVALFATGTTFWGMNVGLVAFAANLVVTFGLGRLLTESDLRVPVIGQRHVAGADA